MIDLRKDWLDNPKAKARNEAQIALAELKHGSAKFLDDIPNEIRAMIADCVVLENGFRLNAIGCQTPIKVRFDVWDDR